MKSKKNKIKGFIVLYKLNGLSPFDIETTDALSNISNDKSISCGKGMWVEDGVIVTPCPIVAQTYNDSYSLEHSITIKRIPDFA